MAKIPTDILAEYEDDIDLTGVNDFNSSFTKECFQLLVQNAISIGFKAHQRQAFNEALNENLKSFAYFMDSLFGLENLFRFWQ